MAGTMNDPDFPCSITISVPLPTHRLARTALRALEVDAELSPLVKRSFSLADRHRESNGIAINVTGDIKLNGGTPPDLTEANSHDRAIEGSEHLTILRAVYKATTNRMLRVAVNGFMESLGVALGVMAELDVDVLSEQG